MTATQTRSKGQKRRRAARRATHHERPAGQPPLIVDDEPDHQLFVLGAIRVTGFLFAGQIAGTIVGAFLGGHPIVVRLRFGILPSIGVPTPNATAAADISTMAMLGSVAAIAVAVLLALSRRRDQPLLLQGWGAGIPMAGVLIALQLARHLADPPHVDLWRLSQAAAAVAAVGLLYLGFAPTHVGPLRRVGSTSPEDLA